MRACILRWNVRHLCQGSARSNGDNCRGMAACLRREHYVEFQAGGGRGFSSVPSDVRSVEETEKQAPVSLESFYDVTVEKYASRPMQNITLKELMMFGQDAYQDESKILRSARFVQREIPIRLAKRLLDLQFLPYVVVTNPHIKQVYDAYRRAFNILRTYPSVTCMEENLRFTKMLTVLVDEQGPLLEAIARGVKECASRPLASGTQLDLDRFLDNMLRSRISRRVIAEQHISFQHWREGFVGVICTELSVVETVQRAIARTELVCRDTYGLHQPEFQITGDLGTSFAYIPAHLDYMLYEILKNASRAVVEHHMKKKKKTKATEATPSSSGQLGLSAGQQLSSLPPIIIQICESPQEVTIKVSDRGGGIGDKDLDKIWCYGFSTVDESSVLEDPDSPSTSAYGLQSWSSTLETQKKSPMAGLGFGLPLSRLYAQYFGGNLQLVSLPGYGTDVYIRIHRLGTQAEAIEI